MIKDQHINREENEEEITISESLKLQLLATTLGIIANAISMWAILEAMEDVKTAQKSQRKEKENFNEQLANMQSQIHYLLRELEALKQKK